MFARCCLPRGRREAGPKIRELIFARELRFRQFFAREISFALGAWRSASGLCPEKRETRGSVSPEGINLLILPMTIKLINRDNPRFYLNLRNEPRLGKQLANKLQTTTTARSRQSRLCLFVNLDIVRIM